MYGVAGEKRPIFVESDSFLYNLGDPSISRVRVVGCLSPAISYIKIFSRENRENILMYEMA
jgi:hypothetical protein